MTLPATVSGDLRSRVESEPDDVTVPVSADGDEPPGVATFDARSLEKVQQKLKVPLVKQTRSSFASADGATIVVCKASRAYEHRDGTYGYWFGFYEFQMEMIANASNGFAAFQCGTPENLLLIPASALQSWTDQMNQTRSKRNSYWHVHIENLQLIPKSGSPLRQLTSLFNQLERVFPECAKGESNRDYFRS